MNPRQLLPIALLLVPLTASGAWGQNQARSAATPEEAVKLLTDSARAGDLDTFVAQTVAPMRELMVLSQDMERLQQAFESALDDKFGKMPDAKRRPTLKEALADDFKALKSVDILEKTEKGKELAVLKIKVTKMKDGTDQASEATFLTVREPGGWKVAPVPEGREVDDKMVEKMAREVENLKPAIARQKDLLQRFTLEIKDGKYKSREEATRAFVEAAVAPQPGTGTVAPPPKEK